ncbi:MAG: sulfotransferase [Gammaproteobacteria bacterium]
MNDMIFVTGASRSGTTMLSRILGQHSRVAGLKELHCFGDLIDPNRLQSALSRVEAIDLSTRLIARSKRDVWGSVEEEDRVEATGFLEHLTDGDLTADSIISSTLSQIAENAGKEIPCEQTPRNIFYAQRLLEAFPELKIVHIVRDPRDVLASQKNRWQRKRLGGSNIPWSEIIRVWFNYHPYTITKMWLKANRLALQLQDHDRFYMLRFEDLIEDPQTQVEKISGFLGLSYEKIMLDIPQVGSSHSDNTEQQTGVRKSTLNRWKTVLSSGEVIVCEKLAKPLMDQFSYPLSAKGGALDSSVIMQVLKYPLHAAGVLLSNPRRAWIQFQAVLGKSK